MGYSTGLLRYRVAVMRRARESASFGKERSYEYAGTLWAGIDYSRGSKSLREGALDAYDRLIVRIRWTNIIDRFCMLVYEGRTFQIESFNEDKYDNQIQLTIVEAPGKDLSGLIPTPTPPYSTSELGESPEGNI